MLIPQYFQSSLFLQKLYVIIYVLLAALIVSTPILISGSVRLTRTYVLDEEIIEVILLCILFSLSFVILKLYRREVRKHKEIIDKIKIDKKTTEERLLDSLNYIGTVNVQIEEIKSIFNTTNRYPETKNDFKKSFRFLGDRVLGIVNTSWVLFRIIDVKTRKTIAECFETRQGVICPYPHISNKMIVEHQPHFPFTAIFSSPQNLNIIVCCNLPTKEINKDQHVFIQAIVNEITMLFIVLNSTYYKNENNRLKEKKELKIVSSTR